VCGELEIEFRSKPIKNRIKPLSFERKPIFTTQTRVRPGSGSRVEPPEVEDELSSPACEAHSHPERVQARVTSL
jgi:hypothetical protein